MMLKYLFISFFFTSASLSNLGDDITKIATKQVKELDEILLLIDPNAGLSLEQKQLVIELFSKKIQRTREIKASEQPNKSQLIKELMKEITDQLHNDILTKSQREAKFEYQTNYQSN